MLLALIVSLAFLGLLVLGGWLADKALRHAADQWAARTARQWPEHEPTAHAAAANEPELRRTSRGARGATSRPRAVRASG